MSDTPRVGIEVAVDGSGAEAGLSRVDAAVTRTGRNLDTLGERGSAALDSVGTQGGAAAGRVDSATRNMAASIQRATAAMSAGAKGSAEYYAALANSRGLNVAALKPYLDQLDAVTKKTAAAAEAQRQLEANTRFLDGLRSQAEGIGKTASQLAALRAEQLGVAEAARPFIEQLREAEEAAGGATESFSSMAQAISAIAFGGSVAAIVQLSDEYGKYVAQLRLATEGQTEFQNAQNAVRRIATTSQADLSATASLYANITKGTRELGLAQTQVANITETVSLALKVSGASGAEASSAILQLSQAFASGTLRGDEFNSVNEAAPRLMQALADGMGVPIGALRKMAEEGKLTTAVLADSLPRALGTLREEAKSVESIAGAYAVLKNNILEMVGATAQSNGVVAALSGSINLLAENLTLAAGAMGTIVAVKLGTSLAAVAREAYAAAAANQARLTSNLAAARADVAATASASVLAAARVAELRASVLAADGAVALAIATNGLIPAQTRAAAASAAHTAALSAQTAAMGAASVAGRAASGALALLGGPVGAVITLLGVAATAWAVWGEAAEKSGKDISETTEATTEEVIASLDKQIAKLKERNRLAEIGFKPAEIQAPGAEELAKVVAQIDRVAKAEGEYKNLGLAARTEILKVLGGQYGVLTEKIAAFNRESEVDANNRNKKTAGEWMLKYANNAEKMTKELEKAREELGAAFTPELEKRIKNAFEERKSGADKEASAYANLKTAIDERIVQTAREAAGLKPLTDSQKMQVELEAGLASGKVKLTAAQKADYEAKIRTLGLNEQIIESHKRTAQAQADVEKLFKSLADERKREVDAARQEAERNELVAATYGMTKVQIEELTLARLEDQLAQAKSQGMVLDDIEHLRTLIDLKKRSVEALKEVDSREIAERSAKEAEEAWKRTAASIEESLTDALMRGFESGKSFAENLRDATVNMFKTMILRPTIQAALQPVSLPLSSALQTSGAGGLSMAANSAGSVLGIGSLLGSAGSIGAGAVQTAGALLTGQIGLGSTLSAGLSAIGTGSAAGISAGLSSVVGALGPIALGIAGVATILSKGFGRGPKTTTGQGITGTFGVESFTGENYTEWMKKGGWFSSTKRGTDYSALGTEQASALNSAYAAIKSSTSAFAEALGVPADVVTAYSKTIKLALTGEAAKDQETLAALFVQMGDELATRVVPNIEQFIQQGETAATTLQRVANNFTSMNTIMQAIGVDASAAFGAVGVASLDARERLLSLVGGLDALATQTIFFAQNFLSEAERMAPTQKAVNEQLAALGYAGVQTADQFKGAIMDLVNGGGLATEAGAKTYAALLALAPAFKEVTDYTKQLAAAEAERAKTMESSRNSLLVEIMQLEGDAAGALSLQRQSELAAMEESLRPLQLRKYALEDEARAVSLLQTAAGDAFAALRRSVDAQKEAAQAAFDDMMSGIEATIDAASTKVSALQSLASALSSANVAGVTEAQAGARQQDAQAQLAAALAIAKASGVLPSADSLKGALAAVSVDTSDRYASFVDFQRDQLRTAGTIKELSDITDTELSVSQRALATLQDQKKAAQEAFDAEMAMYDEMLEKAQQQLDAINGVRTDVMTVAAAFNSFAASIAKALGNPTIGNQPSVDGRTQIESLYNSVLGRTSDAAGLQYYLGLYNSGASLGNIKQDLMNSDEYKKLRGFAVGTNYVPETMPALIHEGERIIPAADNRALMAALERPGRDDSAVVAELQALRAEVATLRAFTVQTAQNTGKTSDLINNISGGGGPLLVQLEEA